MRPCRITVLKTMYNEEIAIKYRRPDIHRGSCPYLSEGQEFVVREPTVMPEDFPCGWAWNDIERMVFALMTGGDMGRWMIKGNTFVTCCTDGIKPVVFLLERIEEGGTGTGR